MDIVRIDNANENPELHNSRIDILRILACFFVIAIHVLPSSILADSLIDKQALLLHVIVADAVGIFFSITGYLAFRKERLFKHIILRFIRKVAYPTLIAGLFSQVFYRWIRSDCWRISLQSLSFPDILALLSGIISHTPSKWNNLCSIYWYVFDYARLLLWFPAILVITRSKNGDKIILSAILLMGFGLLMENAKTVLQTYGISLPISTYRPLPFQLTILLMGYLMYKYIDKISNRVPAIICFIFYLALIIARYFLQYRLYQFDSKKTMFDRYDGVLSLITVFSLYLLIWKIQIKSHYIKRILKMIAGRTFHIYLIHYMILYKLRAVRVLDRIMKCINYLKCPLWFKSLMYNVLVVLILFVLSLLCSFFITYISKRVNSVFENKK